MNLDKILIKAGQIKDVAYSIEGALIEADNGSEPLRRATNLFYVLLEQLNAMSEELDKLSEHISVCNAIFAVNRVDELKREIATLKGVNNQDT